MYCLWVKNRKKRLLAVWRCGDKMGIGIREKDLRKDHVKKQDLNGKDGKLTERIRKLKEDNGLQEFKE